MSCINCFESSDHNGLAAALECWQVYLLAFLLLLGDNCSIAVPRVSSAARLQVDPNTYYYGNNCEHNCTANMPLYTSDDVMTLHGYITLQHDDNIILQHNDIIITIM